MIKTIQTTVAVKTLMHLKSTLKANALIHFNTFLNRVDNNGSSCKKMLFPLFKSKLSVGRVSLITHSESHIHTFTHVHTHTGCHYELP